MTSSVLGVRRRARCLLLVAVLLTALIGVMAPSTAGADPVTTTVVGANPGDVAVKLNNDKLTITNKSKDLWIYGVTASPNGPGLRVVDFDARSVCGTFNNNLICAFQGPSGPESPPFAKPPGAKLSVTLGYGQPGGLSRLEVQFLDAQCVNDAPFGIGLLPMTFTSGTGRARAAKLDECARDALGLPVLTESGAGGGKVGLILNGAQARWATRVFGGASRTALKTATSGETVTTIGATSKPYPPFLKGIFSLKPSVKFLRAAWTKKGEKPILGPILAVRR
jgi:hypothetical protein